MSLRLQQARTFKLAGHDWGAAVAWAVALTAPDQIERLTILNVPHPAVMMRHLRRDPGQILRSSVHVLLSASRLTRSVFRAVGRRTLTDTSRPGTFTPEDLDRYSEAWRQSGCLTGMINWYRALLRVRPPLLPDPIVRPPTTIIWGKQDRFLRHEMAAESTTTLLQGRLLYFDDANPLGATRGA